MELSLVRTLLIDESTFDNCTGNAGGALHLSQGPFRASVVPSFAQQPLAITNSRFVNNRAIGNGGSVAIKGVTAEIKFSGCTFLNSTSDEGWGGSVFVQGAASRAINVGFFGCAFIHSVALRGGAVFASLLRLGMQATSFSHTYGEFDCQSAPMMPMEFARSSATQRNQPGLLLALLIGLFVLLI